MANYKITIMDHRHNGLGSFKFYISPAILEFSPRIEQFVEWRKWCWDTWGPGVERDLVSYDPEVKWGWAVKDSGQGLYTRLYFRSVDELNWFKLRWS